MAFGANERIGVLLLNVGSPEKPETRAVRRYLRQFLSDPRVIDLAAWKRALILNLFILPFRPKRSAHAYQSIWTERGSPLIAISTDFARALGELLPDVEIAIGMAYGKPAIADALESLCERGLDRILVAPMFPQSASATTGSVLEATYKMAAVKYNVPALCVVPPFYAHPAFLRAWAAIARPQLDEFAPDHVLFSFHGLPERQIRKGDLSGGHCLVKPGCCDAEVPENNACYRRQCFETARGIAEAMELPDDLYSVSFQSRLGREPWLQPYTDQTIAMLADNGLDRLAVVCPAFTVDCLETLEEIGMGGRDIFLAHGGAAYLQVSCPNAHPAWVEAFAEILSQV